MKQNLRLSCPKSNRKASPFKPRLLPALGYRPQKTHEARFHH
jgi:hypothetical protein